MWMPHTHLTPYPKVRQYEVRWKEVLCLVVQRKLPMQQRMQHVDSLASWKILNGHVSTKKRHAKTRSPITDFKQWIWSGKQQLCWWLRPKCCVNCSVNSHESREVPTPVKMWKVRSRDYEIKHKALENVHWKMFIEKDACPKAGDTILDQLSACLAELVGLEGKVVGVGSWQTERLLLAQ